jgi:hypothetical protein
VAQNNMAEAQVAKAKARRPLYATESEQSPGTWKAVQPGLWVASGEKQASDSEPPACAPVQTRDAGFIFAALRKSVSGRALLIKAVSAWRGAVRSFRPRQRHSSETSNGRK